MAVPAPVEGTDRLLGPFTAGQLATLAPAAAGVGLVAAGGALRVGAGVLLALAAIGVTLVRPHGESALRWGVRSAAFLRRRRGRLAAAGLAAPAREPTGASASAPLVLSPSVTALELGAPPLSRHRHRGTPPARAGGPSVRQLAAGPGSPPRPRRRLSPSAAVLALVALAAG
ncbi:MAG: hypothetical protein ACYDAQ_03230, partial [Mycobacteriales bacterium]